MQPRDQARSRRSQFGPDLPLEVLVDQVADPAAQLG
jgi:alkanesulfonate monooxygenase SsuD/methylene tetrahydromethanopterin reductase-like flavin-dependent oxidoreductase (luciferase family)